MRTVVTAEKLWNGTSLLDRPMVAIEDGRIASIATRESGELPAGTQTRVFDYPGAMLAPAFLDVHIHGAAGHDVMEATPEALNAVGGFLATRGTGSFLATTVTAPLDATLRAVAGLARLIEKPQLIEDHNKNGRPTAKPVGLHLEGQIGR